MLSLLNIDGFLIEKYDLILFFTITANNIQTVSEKVLLKKS